MNIKINSRLILVSVLCWIIIALSFNLHGFSISLWAQILESPLNSIFQFGYSRPIRSDDWLVAFATWQAQLAAPNANPIINPLIGFGQNMVLLSPTVFVKHWTTFFNLHTWGFLFGLDFGMSWLWTFHAAGIFIVLFLLIRQFCSKFITPFQSALLALGFLFSNFLQFFSYRHAGVGIIYGGLSLYFFTKLISEKGWKLIVFSFLFVWSSFAFFLVFYPPFQVSIAQFLFIIGLVIVLWHLYITPIKSNLFYKILHVCLLGICVAALVFALYSEFKDVFYLIQNTSYPGKRIAHGGGLTIFNLFSDAFLPLQKIKDYSLLNGNISEAGRFINFIPLLYVLGLFSFKKLTKFEKICWSIAFGFGILFFCWWTIGSSFFLFKLTSFGFNITNRSTLSLGLLNLILILLWLCNFKKISSKSKVIYHIIFIFWLVFIVLIYKNHVWNHYSILFNDKLYLQIYSIVLFSVFLILSYFLIFKYINFFCIGLCITSIVLTFRFNPIVFGGGKKIITQSRVLQLIENVEKQHGTGAWIIWNGWGQIPNLVGARSFSGSLFYPQYKLWKILDPNNNNEFVWNRYDNLTFLTNYQQSTTSQPMLIKNSGPDSVHVVSSLDNNKILQIPFSYLLINNQEAKYVPTNLYQFIGNTENWSIYKINR